MNLKLLRNRFNDIRTTGQLYVDEEFFCFTLEDKVREIPLAPVEKWKVQDETAIPQGRYRVTLDRSPKFGPDTISLHDVPGFQYIRIHSGNTEKDTEGCIILGYRLNNDNTVHFGTTRPAVNDLKNLLKRAIDKKEQTWISVIGLPKYEKL